MGGQYVRLYDMTDYMMAHSDFVLLREHIHLIDKVTNSIVRHPRITTLCRITRYRPTLSESVENCSCKRAVASGSNLHCDPAVLCSI